MWGAIRPTKAMAPENATAAPVISDAASSRTLRVKTTRTPRALASSSLTMSRFRSRDSRIAIAIPNSTKGVAMRMSVQVDAPSPPASQKSISRCA